jgi:hypothetical protein
MYFGMCQEAKGGGGNHLIFANDKKAYGTRDYEAKGGGEG